MALTKTPLLKHDFFTGQPHFPRFRVRIFHFFAVFASWNLLRPLFFGDLGQEKPSAFSAFSAYRV